MQETTRQHQRRKLLSQYSSFEQSFTSRQTSLLAHYKSFALFYGGKENNEMRVFEASTVKRRVLTSKVGYFDTRLLHYIFSLVVEVGMFPT